MVPNNTVIQKIFTHIVLYSISINKFFFGLPSHIVTVHVLA